MIYIVHIKVEPSLDKRGLSEACASDSTTVALVTFSTSAFSTSLSIPVLEKASLAAYYCLPRPESQGQLIALQLPQEA